MFDFSYFVALVRLKIMNR